ncbi:MULTISPECIES: alpha/beta hydrolase [Metabacillus]|uniref:Alpha/beta hydrolase n=1 Tax=Metabacillus hrfriensis TaxID=3048891 RepID=A0ACD4RDB7_9BACI|nr:MULTISPECIES: alpha/beta hydrolase [Metabacillus]UAL52953.1 alpha/beta hydrolase [Metabacillus dongyingensis]USK29272.1 alpha/beta hydrolase [Bacillus sp. CMF21]WHZ58491.1 alpha/beta hydrolase [Metabacillus sp. CT-WN-B3]
MKLKKNIALIAAISLAAIVFIIQTIKPEISNGASDGKHEGTPTVFVHGYRGTLNSFEGMMERFQSDYEWGEKTLICTSDKRVAECKALTDEKVKNPLIHVYFEDNDSNFEKTSIELGNILKLLKGKYGHDKVNIVAHSMGGLVSVNYIQETRQEKEFPKVEKLVTIGTPFKGIKREVFEKRYKEKKHDLIADSQAIQELYSEKDNFDPNTQVYSIAGKIGKKEDGDGLVSVHSATSLKNVVASDHYREQIIVSKKATHNGLHENKEVDEEVGRFLWK